ncbi:MAG: LiaF domain-containing protein [Acidimicrobiia bacterium]
MTTTDLLERPEAETPQTPRRRPYGSVVLGALLIVTGGLWFLDAIDAIEIQAALVLPAILAVIGLALVVGSFEGPHRGLVIAGVFVTLAVVAVAAAPTDAFHGGIGQRNIHVTDQTTLAPRYDVGVGELNLDLSDLVMTESANVDITVGAGDLTITLPRDVAVDIDAAVGAGQIALLGQQSDGLSVSRTYRSDDYDTADVALTLNLDVAAGNIEVNR